MNRKRAKELLPIIQAYANGEDIQIKASDKWLTWDSYSFTGIGEYRIKPSPREFWLCWHNCDPDNLHKFEGKKYTELTVKHWDNYIKVRVLNED